MHFNFKQGLFQAKGEILQYISEDGKEYVPYDYNFEEDIVPAINNLIPGNETLPIQRELKNIKVFLQGSLVGLCFKGFGVHHHDGLLNVNGIFEERFDVIVTNPPFGSQVRDDVKITTEDLQDQEAIKQYINKYGDKYKDCLLTEDDVGKAINKRFDIGSKLTEVLFIERCLNLLKKGGRLGIVLPDGVLNGANLQKCRDFVEGKAKILMITSIPQDVFVAAGATVKPSLLFFKKFTEEEELLYNQIKDEATKEVNTKFATQEEDAQQLPTKEKKAKLKEIAEQKASKIKSLIKERFNYEIPIANVQKAGIDTLGNECENQLIEVLQEFKKYQSNHKMWNTPNKKIYKYSFDATKIKREEVA